MSLLRAHEDDQYWPEYSTFCVRDFPGPSRDEIHRGGLLMQYAVDAQPCGSVARAGNGWVDGVASSNHHHAVRMEVHDTAPADDVSEWSDVVETPFRTSGTVRLEAVVGGATDGQFELGRPGTYRLRFASRPVVAGDDPEGSRCEYRLWFWRVDTPADPPRWLRRSSPLLHEQAGQGLSEGRVRRAVSDVVMLALWAAESATPVTLAWLADRLSADTETVRRIVEHPRTNGVLSVDGDLDAAESPLTVTVHSRRPPDGQRVMPAVVGVVPGVDARRGLGRGLGTAPTAVSITAAAAARPKAPAQPAVVRSDATRPKVMPVSHDGSDSRPSDNHPGANADADRTD